ncbi:YeeE/YedE thiosulfate transporter family protein [Halarsenatibacter silvermanii]|uniref:Uncharacterized protein n=1 Tax=Halarsenatibacter silvermanii TaxID=321763 RepID=A0A1G9T6J0_9FIRM|nr:YeeE/YedE thiosulfate transporter family protein [Halarsenatibacter silvermanii]SDM43343.1 hypothetical protein SAMN04488692_1352 [Halarsenatibacter silvermanii]
MLLGGLAGFALQRSNFCFASGMMNFFMFGKINFLRSLILLLVLSSAGFMVYELFLERTGAASALRLSEAAVSPGLHTLLGGVIFGLGMVMAGSCVVGMLMRIGEGSVTFLLVLAGVVAGSSLGSLHLSWWRDIFAFEAVYLPSFLGWPLTIVLYFGLLSFLYFYLGRRKKHK